MATFTVDLLSGNIFLFDGDFGASGVTPTSGTTYPQVNTYFELPAPSTVSGKIYVVRQGTGSYVLNRKSAGFYFSTGTVWRYLGEAPIDLLRSDHFQILDANDNTKGVVFNTSNLNSGVFRTLTIQNSDGTVAYLTDLATKVDISAFADYTGNTATNQFASKIDFVTYTGITAPNIYLSKSDFSNYSGITLLLIQNKQDILTPGNGINIDSGNTISVVMPQAMQLIDTVGGINVNNIQPTPIVWTSGITGNSLYFSGGSRIYIQDTGMYGISYALNVNNGSNSGKNIGSVIRKNGNTYITPMSTTSMIIDGVNDSGTNIMPEFILNLLDGDYIELVAFRIGTNGLVFNIANGTWIKIHKII